MASALTCCSDSTFRSGSPGHTRQKRISNLSWTFYPDSATVSGQTSTTSPSDRTRSRSGDRSTPCGPAELLRSIWPIAKAAVEEQEDENRPGSEKLQAAVEASIYQASSALHVRGYDVGPEQLRRVLASPFVRRILFGVVLRIIRLLIFRR